MDEIERALERHRETRECLKWCAATLKALAEARIIDYRDSVGGFDQSKTIEAMLDWANDLLADDEWEYSHIAESRQKYRALQPDEEVMCGVCGKKQAVTGGKDGIGVCSEECYSLSFTRDIGRKSRNTPYAKS